MTAITKSSGLRFTSVSGLEKRERRKQEEQKTHHVLRIIFNVVRLRESILVELGGFIFTYTEAFSAVRPRVIPVSRAYVPLGGLLGSIIAIAVI